MKLQTQHPFLINNQDVSRVFDSPPTSPPASPCQDLDVGGTSDYDASNVLSDTIDDNPDSISNRHSSGCHDSTERNGIITDAEPLRPTSTPRIGDDQGWIANNDCNGHDSLFLVAERKINHQSLPWATAMQPQVPFSESATLCSQTGDSYPIPGAIECHIEGSPWGNSVTSRRYVPLPIHNYWPFLEVISNSSRIPQERDDSLFAWRDGGTDMCNTSLVQEDFKKAHHMGLVEW